MRFSEKPQADGMFESEGKKWVLAGTGIRTSLKPIHTKTCSEEDEESEPTPKEARIPDKLPCPPPPRKRRPPLRCHYNGVREFFTPPDLETVFKLHVEKAN